MDYFEDDESYLETLGCKPLNEPMYAVSERYEGNTKSSKSETAGGKF